MSEAKKYSIKMDQQIVNEIKQLDKGSSSVAETIRRALKLFKYLKEHNDNGYEIVLEKKSKEDAPAERTKILMP